MTVDIRPGRYTCANNPDNSVRIGQIDPNSLLEVAGLQELLVPILKAKCPNIGVGCPPNCSLNGLIAVVNQNYNELIARRH